MDIPVIRSSMPEFSEYIEEIQDIWDNRWLTNRGPKHQALEVALQEYLGTRNIELFTNGHLALEAALHMFPTGSEIITTPFTYISTTLAIIRSGLKPVFCDIEPTYYTIDTEKIEKLINANTVAIVPVHVYGNVCAWEKIDDIASRYDLKVIYDAAHTFGVRIGERGIGTLGDVSMFSFHATKVFHTIEGGGLVCNTPAFVEETLRAWSQFGMNGKEDADVIGTNAKMTEFQAAMGICNLKHVDKEIELRRRVDSRYRERLADIDGITFCPSQQNVKHNYAYMPVRFDAKLFGVSRDEVSDVLEAQGIASRKYFYPLTSDISAFKNKFTAGSIEVAEQISREILCLPMYAGLSNDDVDRICDAILTIVN